MDLDFKKDWIKRRQRLYLNLLADPAYPNKYKSRVRANPFGLYETPKVYNENGVSFNDGTWLIYNTCRITDKKFRGKVFCLTKKQLLEYLYGYMCFLKKVGVEERDEMIYHAICYLIYKLTYRKGLFKDTKANIEILKALATSVIKKDIDDIKCSRIDRRKYCLDPKMKKVMTTSQKTSFQKKVQKQKKDELIEKWYDPGLSVRGNVKYFKKNNIPISKARLEIYLREHKTTPKVS
jgi:ribosomal protein L20A (L18A)